MSAFDESHVCLWHERVREEVLPIVACLEAFFFSFIHSFNHPFLHLFVHTFLHSFILPWEQSGVVFVVHFSSSVWSSNSYKWIFSLTLEKQVDSLSGCPPWGRSLKQWSESDETTLFVEAVLNKSYRWNTLVYLPAQSPTSTTPVSSKLTLQMQLFHISTGYISHSMKAAMKLPH